jgi:formyltetrahydrofolate-dependent phosphoribosylglycinamide formyltransferase
LNLAILLSGTGRSLANLLRAIAGGSLQAQISVVVSSKPDVRGLEIATAAGIPTAVIERKLFSDDDAYSEAVYKVLTPFHPDLIVMAGYLRKLVVRQDWEGRILNIHPALLPESAAAGRGFYGERVHAAVIASGARESGATVHVVDNEYDAGPVVMRTTVPVFPDDTPTSLGARVFAAECALYPEAIRAYAAAHGGKLPQTLEDLSDATPAPIDPLTGTNFDYTPGDGGFVLEAAPVADRPDTRLKYQVTLVP